MHQFTPFPTTIEAILKELDVKYDHKQERKQNSNQHHVKEGFKSSTLICFKDKIKKDATAKVSNSGTHSTQQKIREFDNLKLIL